MSKTVASALQMLRPDETRETRVFIRMINQFFDRLNVKSPKMGVLHKRIIVYLTQVPVITISRYLVFASYMFYMVCKTIILSILTIF